MVFGELLGGVATRAGERFNENTQRQRAIEDWQRQARVGMNIDFMRQNWDNMDAGQQEAWVNQIAPDLGVKPKDAMAMVTAAKAIHTMIPQIQAVPEALGPTQRTGPVTATLSAEPTVRGIQAPASIQIGQIPQPGEILSPSLMTPTTAHTANYGRAMTPNQIKAQRTYEQQAAERAGKASEIIGRPELSPEYRKIGVGQVYGVPAGAYETAAMRTEAQKDLAKDRLDFQKNKMQASPRFALRNGEQLPIYRRGLIETYYDPAIGKEIPYRFQAGDKVYEKTSTGGIALQQDDNGTYAINKAGALAGQPGSVTKVPGLTGRPKPQSQLTNITTPEGPGLGVYTPSRGGKGRLTDISGKEIKPTGPTIKGTVPPVSPAVQDELIGLGTGNNILNRLKDLFPQVAAGPGWGRLRSVQIKDLGGWGTTPDEVKLAAQLNMMIRTAFDTAGKNFTKNERDIFEGIYPGPNDTVETALIKIPESQRYIQERMEMRKGVMSPMQRTQTKFPDVSNGGSLSVTAPNGKVYTYPTKEAADRFRAATRAK